jgi:Zn finger protein HypA/HybF involved in hydrogenase expression
MSDYYPAGSMKGSGIDSEDWTGVIYCEACKQDQTVDAVTNDWHTKAFATCPKCEADLEITFDYE